jgi:hypothetical protein
MHRILEKNIRSLKQLRIYLIKPFGKNGCGYIEALFLTLPKNDLLIMILLILNLTINDW